jgi:hypothetical protein
LILILLRLSLLLQQRLICGWGRTLRGCRLTGGRLTGSGRRLGAFRLGPRELERHAHYFVGHLPIGADIHVVIRVGDELLLRTELVILGNRLMEELHHARSVDWGGDRGGLGRRSVLGRRLRWRLSGLLRGGLC